MNTFKQQGGQHVSGWKFAVWSIFVVEQLNHLKLWFTVIDVCHYDKIKRHNQTQPKDIFCTMLKRILYEKSVNLPYDENLDYQLFEITHYLSYWFIKPR